MNELLATYAWTLVAGALLAPALAWLGVHLSARGRVMDTLTVSQGAAVGTILGLALATGHHEAESQFQPVVLFSALLCSAAVFAMTRALQARRSPALPALMIGFYFALAALGSVVDSFLLKVDSHVALVYFGDLVTLTDRDAAVALALSAAALLFFALGYRPLGRLSLESAVGFSSRPLRRWSWAFEAVALVLLCFGVQFIGVLFTLAALFLPTALLSLAGRPGLRIHALIAGLVAALGCGLGFVASLSEPSLPTTPTIVLLIAVFSGLAASCLRPRAPR